MTYRLITGKGLGHTKKWFERHCLRHSLKVIIYSHYVVEKTFTYRIMQSQGAAWGHLQESVPSSRHQRTLKMDCQSPESPVYVYWYPMTISIPIVLKMDCQSHVYIDFFSLTCLFWAYRDPQTKPKFSQPRLQPSHSINLCLLQSGVLPPHSLWVVDSSAEEYLPVLQFFFLQVTCPKSNVLAVSIETSFCSLW